MVAGCSQRPSDGRFEQIIPRRSVHGESTFDELTYSIGLIIVYKLKIFYFCSLIILREVPYSLGCFREIK